MNKNLINIHTISEVLGLITLILMLIFIPPLIRKHYEKKD